MITNTRAGDDPGYISTILEALPHPVLIADSDLRIRFVNQSAAEALGYTAPELAGASVYQIVPGHFGAFLQHVVRQMSAGQDSESEWRRFAIGFRHKSGTEVPAEVLITTFDVEGERYMLCTCQERYTGLESDPEARAQLPWLDHSQGMVPIGSWRWDVQADEVTWSSDLCRIFGVPPDEFQLSYEKYLTFLHPDDRDYVKATIDEAMSQGMSYDIEHRIVRPDGTVRHIHGQGAVETDEEGTLQAVVGVARDITDRKAYEEQQFRLALEQAARQEAERASDRFQFLARLSEALGSTLESDAMLDHLMELIIPRIADWCTIHAISSSGAVTRLATGHRDPEKRQLLESVREFGRFTDRDGSHPFSRVVRDAQPVLYTDVPEELMVEAARSPKHLAGIKQLEPKSAIIAPMIARGRAFGVMVFGTSESGRRFTESDVELAAEIAHRAAASIDNASLYQRAQEAARAREQFVSMVSHELKTPLTAIKGYMQVLGRHLDRKDWERDRILGTRDRLDVQVERLELLISDILDASRIQLGRLGLNFQPDTDLVELAWQVVRRFDEAVERKPNHAIGVQAEGPIRGRWDSMRLDQVLANLLSNALKYSPDGGNVRVEIQQKDDTACITVHDEGVGMGEEERAHLFEPFHRGTANQRGISGTGLGLYITKQIVEEHGGTIAVESVPGSHTSVRIELPIDPLAVLERKREPSPESATEGHVQFE